MDPDQFYCYPTAGDDGMIYCAIQYEKTDIVVLIRKKDKSFAHRTSDRKAERLRLVRERWEKSISNARRWTDVSN